MARVLLPLPDTDFDVTEVAVPWRVLTDVGHAGCPEQLAQLGKLLLVAIRHHRNEVGALARAAAVQARLAARPMVWRHKS